jgi:lauroyl/myristoyl acyltransferase
MPMELDTPHRPVRTSAADPRPGTRAPKPPTATPGALSPFFWLAAHAPGLARGLRPLATWLVPLVSGTVRTQTRRNARRIFGRALDAPEQRAYTRGVVSSFYEFIVDIGQSSRESVDQLLARVERVEGEGAYRALRAQGRGAVLVTAHMGAFEVGLAALKRVERRVHVVYKRDATGSFESMRARMRRSLGVIEAPIDDGPSTWMDLRNALLDGDVVVMQADRAMPGQKSAVVPFLHGRLRLPTGAVRLARLTGCPIVPVCTERLASGRFAIHLYPAIEPGFDTWASEPVDPSVVAVGKALESMVAKYPTQWLVLGAAFEQDAAHA